MKNQANENQLVETNVNDAIEIYKGASNLKVEKEEQLKLTASFERTMIEIRPDGLIYLPQVFWRQRLNETFGIGQWALVVRGSHKDPNRDKLYLQGVLMVRGCYVGESVGEAELHSENKNQSWASVWESAKSDSITRCCKDLGIANELWQPKFIQEWQKEFAIKVFCENKKTNKTDVKWRKKNAIPFFNEKGIATNENNQQEQKEIEKKWLNPNTPEWDNVVKHLQGGGLLDEIENIYKISKQNKELLITVPEKHILPSLNDKQFEKVKERIKSGEVGVYEKVKNAFTLTARQDEVLDELEKYLF